MTNTAIAQPPVWPGCAEIEAWLTSRGARYLRVIEIPVANFDERESRHNQARPTPLVPEAVDRYFQSYKDGVLLPPVVAWRKSERSTTFILIDGNNRQAAAKRAGVEKIPTYILAADTPSELIYLLTVEANARHGQPVPTEWRVKQALHLVEIGWETDIARRAAQVNEKTLRTYKSASAADARARALKISNWGGLGVNNRSTLGQLKSDPVLFHAARTAIDTNMNVEETKGLVRDVKACSSEAEQIQLIGRISASRKAEAVAAKEQKRKGQTVSNVKQSLVTAIGKILAVDSAALARLILTEIDQHAVKNRLESLADKVIELQIAVEQAIGKDDKSATA
jgi:hypothetical protein